MVNKKTSAIAFALSLALGLQLSRIYVPEGFESPAKYRLLAFVLKVGNFYAQLGSSLNAGTEASNYRNFVNFLGSFLVKEDEAVLKKDTTMNGVSVRVYSPKLLGKGNKPIMIYYHGGGYSFGSLNTYDEFLFEFVKKLDMIIVAVDYKMTPEYPYPRSINDCHTVTQHVIHNCNELGCDAHKLILAGDSSGGNAAAVMAQRLREEEESQVQPKLQILIYPKTQYVNLRLPSHARYSNSSFTGISKAKFHAWSLGITERNTEYDELLFALEENQQLALVEDQQLLSKYKTYLDPSRIPEKYKLDKGYYADYEKIKNEQFTQSQLPRTNILMRDSNINERVKKLFTRDISPLLADQKYLIGLPKAYFILVEWDELKDEGILYAERLKEAGVDVKVAFYELGFHGIVNSVNRMIGFQASRNMQKDLIEYIKLNL
jgi:acetyl esterase/lipase